MRFVLNPAGRSTSKAKGRWRPISFIANKAARTLFGFLRLFDDRFISVFGRRFYRSDDRNAKAQVGFWQPARSAAGGSQKCKVPVGTAIESQPAGHRNPPLAGVRVFSSGSPATLWRNS
jgi:hypothetical protein